MRRGEPRVAPTRSAGSALGRASREALLPPAGTRDLIWPDSARRRDLAKTILGVFAAHGYDLVTTPPFELETVLSRGLESVDPRDLLRFVEPDSGEVALLRPDITPQIARLVATRLADRPLPMRLCYEGSVLRRRRGRARRHRQIAQAGVEQIGVAGTEGDLEVIRLAARACSAVGLVAIRVELGHVALVRATLRTVPEGARGPIADAIARKDAHELGALLERARVPRAERRRAQALVGMFGDADVIDRAARTFSDAESRRAIAYLRRVADGVAALGGGVEVGVDLGRRAARATTPAFRSRCSRKARASPSAAAAATTTCWRGSTRLRPRPASRSTSTTSSGRSSAPAWRAPVRTARASRFSDTVTGSNG